MRISKKQLLEGFDIFKLLNKSAVNNRPYTTKNKSEEDAFTSPLYDPKTYKTPSPLYTGNIETKNPEGADYSVTYETSPTVQQRLRLKSKDDPSLSKKERGVPLDQSQSLIKDYEPQKYRKTTRTWINPNPIASPYLVPGSSTGPKSITYTDTEKETDYEERRRKAEYDRDYGGPN